ncbi:GNAT family N-acetyltransferase [Sporolactobacillus pectinivorans]|uniref:GNAT family N-acetyltransferase n=1 Tax=Sporolactobacillus pectinivorans TaxID=1591408 RepID=UPI001EFEDAA6|nr:GNAT family N-acetyltransferase [Sporolactobacillus pectinivorans]
MKQLDIRKMEVDEFFKCNNIWDMKKQQKLADQFYNELITGNRVTFVYVKNNEFIGEGSLVFDMNDSDYTIKGKRIYLSRLIVKEAFRNQGIGSQIINFLIDYARDLGYQEMSIGVDIDNLVARNLYRKEGFIKVLFQGKDAYGAYQKLLKEI